MHSKRTMTFTTPKNGYHPKDNELQVVARICWTACILLAMFTGTATMENSTEVPQEIKTKNYHMMQESHLGYLSEGNKNTDSKDRHTIMFMAALLTIAKAWKPHKCPSTDTWAKKFSYRTHTNYNGL